MGFFLGERFRNSILFLVALLAALSCFLRIIRWCSDEVFLFNANLRGIFANRNVDDIFLFEILLRTVPMEDLIFMILLVMVFMGHRRRLNIRGRGNLIVIEYKTGSGFMSVDIGLPTLG